MGYHLIDRATGENYRFDSQEELAAFKYQRYIKRYLRTVAAIDENVGRLLDWLDETGQAENTIVVYTSDQGFFLGEHGWFDKRFMYEPFYDDFGPLNMGLTVRFCRLLRGVLQDAALSGKLVVHACGSEGRSRANGAVLMGAYLILVLGCWRCLLLNSYHLGGLWLWLWCSLALALAQSYQRISTSRGTFCHSLNSGRRGCLGQPVRHFLCGPLQ